jgi:hypothetical protein
MEGERALGLPVYINPAEHTASPNQVILCRIPYQAETPTATKGTLHVAPRIPLSFPIGIDVKFNEDKASIKAPNNTPLSQIEKMMSVRSGAAVALRPGAPHIWVPNRCYEFVSVVPGQKAVMTEAIIKLQEAAKPPAKIDLVITVCDGNHRYSEPVRVPSEASWDQVLTTWRIQEIAENPDADRCLAIAAAHVLKTESSGPIASMDGV